MDSISFPNLGINLAHVGRSISPGGFEIAFYGIIIACAMAAGIRLAMVIAGKTGQDPEQYFNFAILAIVAALLGARAYYVIFTWDYYGKHPLEILNFRGGGLAIYGGVIAGVLTGLWYARRHRIPVGKLLDTAAPALILGQAIGRWGNFFNREAFGGYTDTLFAMRLPQEAVSADALTQEILDHVTVQDGISYIQVHPTFLYEAVWNLCVLVVLLLVTFRYKKRRDGMVFCLYLAGYGLGRFWIEGLRTDQLLLPVLNVPVSQALSALLVLAGTAGAIVLRNRGRGD